ncbi:recombinase family protein [Bacillus spongiae]|uniref:Recombinase family protein n=1 Tax=Bacillus spongiae TaxID=2683610 RepID=A0ABU8HCK0_9BACI
MMIGYASVSTEEQNAARQIKELYEYGCEKVFVEKQSGKGFERPIYQDMREKLRFGDILVVHDLSRFGRNKEAIRDEWKKLTDKEIDVVVLNMPILDTRKYYELEGVGQLVTDLVFTLLSWVVEEERNRIRSAQKEGIEMAKKKGLYKGKQTKYHKNAKGTDKLIYEEVVRLLKAGAKKVVIQEKTNVSRPTINKIEQQIKSGEDFKGV